MADKQLGTEDVRDVLARIERLQQLIGDMERKLGEQLKFADGNAYPKMVYEVARAFGDRDGWGSYIHTCKLTDEEGRKIVCKFVYFPLGELAYVEVRKGRLRWDKVFEAFLPSNPSIGRTTFYRPGRWELALLALYPLAKERLLKKKARELAEQLGVPDPTRPVV